MAGETVTEVHNRLAPRLVTEVVKPTLEAGGDMASVLVLLESVVTGVLAVAVKLGGDEHVLDVFEKSVRKRMAEIRLGDLGVAGQA